MRELYLDGVLFSGTEEEFLAVKKFDYKEWYQNGLHHRIDGPALIYSDGQQEWCQNGNRHRIDGPAVICSDGRKFWYLEDLKFYHFFNRFFPMEGLTKDKFLENDGIY